MIVPTLRAAILLALAAPVALVIGAVAPGAWIVAPALGGALFLLVLVDALVAGRLRDVKVTVPRDVEVGAEGCMTVAAQFAGGLRGDVEASLSLDPRLAPGGRAAFPLGDGQGTFAFVPSRRGTGKVDRLWLRWSGPLGLGARQASRALDDAVRVWPNIGEVRSPALQAFLKDAQYGLIARRIRGEGTQFEALTAVSYTHLTLPTKRIV